MTYYGINRVSWMSAFVRSAKVTCNADQMHVILISRTTDKLQLFTFVYWKCKGSWSLKLEHNTTFDSVSMASEKFATLKLN